MPLGKYCRKSPPSFSFVPRCHGACGLQKYVRRPVADSRALKPASSEPLSSVRVCLSCDGTARRQGMSAALKDAAVLSWALASSRRRLLHPWQLSSSACPLAALTRSAPTPQRGHSRPTGCGRRAMSIRPGSRPLPRPHRLCRLRRRWMRRK